MAFPSVESSRTPSRTPSPSPLSSPSPEHLLHLFFLHLQIFLFLYIHKYHGGIRLLSKVCDSWHGLRNLTEIHLGNTLTKVIEEDPADISCFRLVLSFGGELSLSIQTAMDTKPKSRVWSVSKSVPRDR